MWRTVVQTLTGKLPDKVIKRLVIGGLIAGLMLVVGQPSLAQEASQWGKPVRLSLPEVSGWFPDITVDATGQIHVVWASAVKIANGKSYDAVLYTTSQDGKKWSEVVDIAVPELGIGEATRPIFFVDQQGILHTAYRGTSVYYSHAPVQTAYNADSWLSPRRISANQVGYFSYLAADSQGALHLVYTENVPSSTCEVCYHVFHRKSLDNGITWSNLTEISILPTGAAKPQIIIDGQDNLHVVWEAGIGGAYGQLEDPTKVMYSASYDQGNTWTFPTEFISPNNWAKNIAIGLQGKDKLLVVWLGLPEDLIYYQISQDQGRSWSPPRILPGIWGGSSVYPSRLDDYAMASDSAGNPHLVLVGRKSEKQTSLEVLHLNWNGTAWSSPETIVALTGDVPEWPRIAIGNGNQLHVVWFVRDKAHIWDSDNQRYQIWYSRGSSTAPAVAPIVWPTSTPTPTSEILVMPTRTPTPKPSPTSVPTLDPAQAQISIPPGTLGSIYTDNDEITLLLMSLVPTLLVIGVVAIIVTMKRH